MNDVSFTLTRGTLTSLIGPNGAGKTTLFNAISGVGRLSEGRVAIAGTDVTGWQPHRIAALGVGRTFQNARLFGEMTVLENVIAGAFRTESIVVRRRSVRAAVVAPLAARQRPNARAIRSRGSRSNRSRTRSRKISRSAIAGASNSRARPHRIRGCCSSTNRRPDSTRANATRSPPICSRCATPE